MNPNFAAMIAAKNKNKLASSISKSPVVGAKKKKKKKLTSPSSKILTKNNLLSSNADTDSDGM